MADVDPRYGLMADTNCDAPLPVNSITEEFTFGQFIRLTRQVGDLVAAVELTRSRRERPTLARAHPAVSFEEALGESPAELRPEDGGIALLPQGAAREVEIADLDALLATGRVALGDEGEAEVGLARAEVSALLAGRPVQLRARLAEGTDLLRLTPPGPLVRVAAGPAVEEHEVTDLAGFLARPLVPGLGGLSYPLTLTPEQVGELRRRGRTAVEVAGSGDAASVTTVQLRMRRRGGDGDGDGDSGGDGDGGDERPGGDGSGGSGGGSGRPSGGGAGSGAGSSGGSRTDPGPAGGSEEPDPPTPGTGQVVLFLPWRQTWLLRGYSREPLVTTLSLGPQEETTIEVFSWDRSRRSLEQSSSTDVEQSFESSDTTKDVVDVVKDMTRNENLQLQANASLRVMYGAVDAQLSGGANRTETVGNVAKRTANHLTEAVSRAATRVRTNRQTKIIESSEVGREERVTRRVRNANQCRTLDLDYFEVVANHRITTTFAKDDAAVCVLIGLPAAIRDISWTREDLRTHERAIRLGLLDPAMAPGLAAARLLEARETAFRLACQKAVCATASGVAPGGGGPKDDDVVPSAELVRARAALTKLQATYQALHQASADPLMGAWDDGYEPPSNTALLAFRLWLYRKLLERLLPRLRRALEQLLGADFGVATRQQVGDAWASVSDAMPSASSASQLDSLGSDKADVSAVVWPVVNKYSGGWAEDNWYWNTLTSWKATEPDDDGLPATVDAVRSAMSALVSAEQAESVDPGTPGGAVKQASEAQAVDTDTDRVDFAFPLRDVAEAAEREDALLRHVKAHDQYYKFAIFQMLPLGDQIQHFGSLQLPVELLEPRVIGAIQTGSGVLLAVPLNPALSAQAQAALDLFLLENPEVRDFAASRDVTLPTPGVTVEGRLGACSCCEPDTTERMRLERERTAADAALVAGRAAWLEQDARRYRLRLDADPPDLTDPRSLPSAPEVMVTVRQEPPDPDI